jgi:hypothetical protein
MSTFKQLQENVIAEVINPSAECMATTLDHSSATFQTDYYNLSRLRYAVRLLANGPILTKSEFVASQQPVTIDTTGAIPVWRLTVDSSDSEGEEVQVEIKFNPEHLMNVIQSASPKLINDQMKGTVRLLKQCSEVKGGVHYADAIDMIEYINEAIQKGVIE